MCGSVPDLTSTRIRVSHSTCVEVRRQLCLPVLVFHFVLQVHTSSKMGGPPASQDPLVSLHVVSRQTGAGITDLFYHVQLCVVSEDPNADSHVFMARVLLTDPPTLPWSWVS